MNLGVKISDKQRPKRTDINISKLAQIEIGAEEVWIIFWRRIGGFVQEHPYSFHIGTTNTKRIKNITPSVMIIQVLKFLHKLVQFLQIFGILKQDPFFSGLQVQLIQHIFNKTKTAIISWGRYVPWPVVQNLLASGTQVKTHTEQREAGGVVDWQFYPDVLYIGAVNMFFWKMW